MSEQLQDATFDIAAGSRSHATESLAISNLDFQSTDFADYTDYNECGVDTAKSAGINSPQLAAFG